MKLPTALQIWTHCQCNGIELFTEEGKLFATPRERVPADIAQAITHHKEAIIRFLIGDHIGEIVAPEALGIPYTQWLLQNVKDQSEQHRRELRQQEALEA